MITLKMFLRYENTNLTLTESMAGKERRNTADFIR